MRAMLQRFIDDTKAKAAFEFSVSMLIFMPLFLVFVDLMLLVMYQADMQRATYMVGEAIRARTQPLVNDPAITGNSTLTTTSGQVFFDSYCEYLIFKGNCKFLKISTYAGNSKNLYQRAYTYSGTYSDRLSTVSNVPIDMSKSTIHILINGFLDLSAKSVNYFSLTPYIYQYFSNDLMSHTNQNKSLYINNFLTLVTLI